MRKIDVLNIADVVARLCVEANVNLRNDVVWAIKRSLRREKNGRAKAALRFLLENERIASKEKIPICQDTGLTVVFVELGQDVHLVGGALLRAVNKGAERGYKKGYLRKSVVGSPLNRQNTNTNTPVLLHTTVVRGDKIKIWVMPKGFGSENKSSLCMLTPADGEDGIIEFVLDAVRQAGPEACPPFVLGIGIGGTFDYAAYLSKKALLQRLDRENPDKRLRILEKRILNKINDLRIGPMGLGGKTTALGVKILSAATHIAGLPVAVNVNCHAMRSAYGVI